MRLTITESYNINNATNNKHDNNHCNKCGNSNEIVNKNSAGLEDQEPRQVKNQSARGIKLRICKATGRQLSSFGLVHPNAQNQDLCSVCRSGHGHNYGTPNFLDYSKLRLRAGRQISQHLGH